MSKISEIFSLDLRSLAMLRIGLGLFILGEALCLLPYVNLLLSSDGVLPTALIDLNNREYAYQWQLYFFSDAQLWPYFLLTITILSAVALILGFYTRTATFLCWILLAALMQRNPHIAYGAYPLALMILFWSLFLPLGARFALDSCYRGSIAKVGQIFSIATVGLYTLFVILYLSAALYKLDLASWSEGTHIYYALSMLDQPRWLGQVIYQYPQLLEHLTYQTIFLELFGPLLFISPIATKIVRSIVIAIFLLFHLGLALTLSLGLFPLINIALLLGFLPPAFWSIVNRKNKGAEYQEQGCKAEFELSKGITIVKPLILSLCLLTYSAWHFYSVTSYRAPQRLHALVSFLFPDNRFDMFSRPIEETGWWAVMPSSVEDNGHDLIRNRSVSIDSPPNKISRLPHKLSLYLSSLRLKPDRARCRQVLQYYRSRQVGPAEHLAPIELVYFRQLILPEYKKSPYEAVMVCELRDSANDPEDLIDS